MKNCSATGSNGLAARICVSRISFMPLATQSLPDDPDALRVFARDLQAELARKDIELAANAAENRRRRVRIDRGRLLGTRAEEVPGGLRTGAVTDRA